MSFLLSHAYYITPHAARVLLHNFTRDLCNWHKQDYAMRSFCLSRDPALDPIDEHGASPESSLDSSPRSVRCLKPPRGLWQRGDVPGRSDFDHGGRTLGWGLFTQDHHATPSYNSIARGGRAANFSERAARAFESERRCRLPGAGAPQPSSET